MLLVMFVCVFVALTYYSFTKRNDYWKKKGIKYLKPLPFFGNMAPYVFKKRPFTEIVEEMYWKHPEERYLGFYLFSEPAIMIRDTDLIKQIMVKDFDFFPEHQTFVPQGVDPLWDKNLFAMKGGNKWHDMRSVLSPSFTSSKMRLMFPLMQNCTKQFTNFFRNQNRTVSAEMNDTYGRIISDLIATTSFGVVCDSLGNKDNQFCCMGQKVNDTGGNKRMLNFFHSMSPTLMKVCNITMRKKEVTSFFRSVIKDTIKLREDQGIIRPDMIHLMLEARRNRTKNQLLQEPSPKQHVQQLPKNEAKLNKPEITDDDMAAQALDFFAAGVETTSTLLAYTTYELTLNPDIQNRLLEEICTTIESRSGSLDYDGLLGMKYLDMVISESLRKWPPSEVTDRLCARPFTIEPKSLDERPLTIEPNTICWIPTYSLQHDPKYYPDPEKFDPERFNEQNKPNINPSTFLPFGIGPRSCIGMRFALLMAKLALCDTVRNFELVPVEETQVPLVLCKGHFNMATEKGIWLGLKPRTGVS